MPFIRSGIPYVDLVGLPYDHWHLTTDTPERCSPHTMESVATVLMAYLRTETRSPTE